MDRRTFIKTSCAICGVGAVGAALTLESCKKKTTTPQGPSVNFSLDLSQSANQGLTYPGGSLPSNGVVIVNQGTSYTAVAQKCTHQGCSVAYDLAGNNFVCPCHNGTYDINGKVVSGPPPAPLKTYTVTRTGNTLKVSG